MYKLQLNDASTWDIVDNVSKTTVKYDGESVSAIVFQIANSDSETIATAFKDSFNTKEMTQLTEAGATMASFTGYTKCKRIARDEVEYDDSQTEVFEVTMMQPSDITDTVTALNEKVSTMTATISTLETSLAEAQTTISEQAATITDLNTTIAELTATVDPADMDLADLQTYMVALTKSELETYLAANPITSSCHGDTAKQYTITSEKQSQLTSAIALANIAEQQGNTAYVISWNATGEECTYDWTLAELVQLAFEIYSVVRPLVSYQQSLETAILAATTTDEILAMTIDYAAAAAAATESTETEEDDGTDTSTEEATEETTTEESSEEATTEETAE